MLLAVDAGNRFLKLAVLRGEKVRSLITVETSSVLSGRKKSLIPKGFIESSIKIEGAAVASVVPSINGWIRREVRDRIGVEPLFISNKVSLPFGLKIRNPSKVGSDRLAAAAGAYRKGSNGAIIIDVGSAITVDLIEKDVFRGGLIIAGPELMLQALSDYTEKLPRIQFHLLKSPFNARFDHTEGAMSLGAAIAAVSSLKAAVRQLENLCGLRLPKIITGGGAEHVVFKLPSSWRHDPSLVLKGIHRIWELNNA